MRWAAVGKISASRAQALGHIWWLWLLLLLLIPFFHPLPVCVCQVLSDAVMSYLGEHVSRNRMEMEDPEAVQDDHERWEREFATAEMVEIFFHLSNVLSE